MHVDIGTLVKEDVGEIPEKMLETAYEVVMQGAHLIVGLAQVKVRVDTGSLRDSIRVERGGQGKYWRRVRVRAGGYVTNPKTNRLVDYAKVIEMKYPYMRPSVEEATPEIRMLIEAGVLKTVG